MRIYAQLPWGLDARQWRSRHALGLAPDRTPYGLDRLVTQQQDRIAFRTPLDGGVLAPVAARLRDRLTHYDIVTPGVRWVTDKRLRTADVLLDMDERSGIPAALLPARPPLVCGIAWLESYAGLPAPVRGLVRRAVHAMDAVFVECRAMIEPLVQDLGLDPERVHFVRLGVDAEHFRPTPLPRGANGQGPLVFSVGDDRMRDHATLIAAVRRAQQDVPDLRFELGTTLPVDLPPEVGTLHRRRMDEGVRAAYAAADIVAVALHPTRQGSGLTVILEAMACGRPLVVTANPGLEDYIVDGETGFLVPPGDVAAMARAIATLAADPDRAAAMGAAGRRRVENYFTTAHMAQDLRDVLDAAVAHPLPGHAPLVEPDLPAEEIAARPRLSSPTPPDPIDAAVTDAARTDETRKTP